LINNKLKHYLYLNTLLMCYYRRLSYSLFQLLTVDWRFYHFFQLFGLLAILSIFSVIWTTDDFINFFSYLDYWWYYQFFQSFGLLTILSIFSVIWTIDDFINILFFSYLDYWRFYQFVQLFGLLTIFLIFVFQLCGLALLIPGLLVVFNEDVINDKVLPALKSISIASSNLGDLAKSLSISLIVIGSFVLIVSVVGCCGACYEIRCCLIIVSIHSRSILKLS
jgi:hypothetical protein